MSVRSENYPFFAVALDTFAISDYSAVKVYSNINLQHVKIGELHQGLILLCHEIEVCMEGIGFDARITSLALNTIGLSMKLNFFGDPFR